MTVTRLSARSWSNYLFIYLFIIYFIQLFFHLLIHNLLHSIIYLFKVVCKELMDKSRREAGIDLRQAEWVLTWSQDFPCTKDDKRWTWHPHSTVVLMSHYQANTMGGFCLRHGHLLPYLSSRLPQVISGSNIVFWSLNLQPWTRVSYSTPTPESTCMPPGCRHWLLVS